MAKPIDRKTFHAIARDLRAFDTVGNGKLVAKIAMEHSVSQESVRAIRRLKPMTYPTFEKAKEALNDRRARKAPTQQKLSNKGDLFDATLKRGIGQRPPRSVQINGVELNTPSVRVAVPKADIPEPQRIRPVTRKEWTDTLNRIYELEEYRRKVEKYGCLDAGDPEAAERRVRLAKAKTTKRRWFSRG